MPHITYRTLSLNILISLLQSLKKKPEVLKLYDDLIREQEKLGFIEKVYENAVVPNKSKVHYLPHHPVHKDSLTTPIRIVYDCSAKASKHSPSLNDCLYTGPNLINNLVGFLLRFRLGKVACISDVEKGISYGRPLRKRQRFVQIFWPNNPFDDDCTVQVYRFKVVLFGSTTSQFLLNSTIIHHFAKLKHRHLK